jgi:hypothetical protein
MGPGKPSSLVTTLLKRPSLLRGGFVVGEWGSPGWRLGRTIAESQDFILRAETQFWPSRDFAEGCRTLDPRGHAYEVLVRFFPYRMYTDSNHRDTLGYECPLACCFHLLVCLVVLDRWIRWLWLWLWLSWLRFNNNVNYLVGACFMHVIIYRCKPNTWLN